MNTYDVFQLYIALKLHFDTESYDFTKYQGKVKHATPQSLEKRHDRYFFSKLAKHRDPKGKIIACLLSGWNWIGDIVDPEADQIYNKWVKRIEGLSYVIPEQCKQFVSKPFNDNFIVKDNQYPPLLQCYLRDDISIETLIVLDDLVHFTTHWNKHLGDDVVWQRERQKIDKYRSLMPKYDKQQLKQKIREIYADRDLHAK